LMHTLSRTFPTTHMDFDHSEDAIPPSRTSTRVGPASRGSPKRAVSVHTEFPLQTGKVESDDLQNNGLPEGKPTQGQQPAGESGSKSKGGTLVSRKFSVHGETEHVEPKFSRDDNHIRHSLLRVATPKYPISFDDMGKLSFGGRQTMSLKKGNQRAPTHSQRSVCAKAGSPTRREAQGDGTLIVPEREAKKRLIQGRSNPRRRVRACQ
jgi:hypothetical protein